MSNIHVDLNRFCIDWLCKISESCKKSQLELALILQSRIDCIVALKGAELD